MKFQFKINPITGKLNMFPKVRNKLIYTNEIITIEDNSFLILISPVLKGESEIIVEGEGELRII